MTGTPDPGPGHPRMPPGPKPITGSPQTLAQHALTIDPRTGLPRGERPPAGTAAVVSLVCGILLCLGPLTAVPAIIAGILARRAALDRPNEVGGGSLGVAGMALGCLNLAITAGISVYVILSVLE